MLRDLLLIPSPGAPVAWAELRARYAWVETLHRCPQDPLHHPEGDVGEHSRLCLDALVSMPAWQALPEAERDLVFAAVLLHDVGKPETTREEDGRWRAPGHARAGSLRARRLLWESGVDAETREAVCGLVRWHMRPAHLLNGPDPKRELYRVSMSARWDHLLLVATADAAGRGRALAPETRELYELLGDFAAEESCGSGPRAFANDRSRVEYFATPGRDPDYAAHDSTWGEILLVAGLPGSGKSTWLARNHPGLPQVCRDDIRAALGLRSGEDEARVTHESHELAKTYLRKRQPFAYNATHLIRDLRAPLLALAHNYGARVRAVTLEVDPGTQRAWNTGRSARVPEAAMTRILGRWDAVDATEVEARETVWPARQQQRGARPALGATTAPPPAAPTSATPPAPTRVARRP